MSRRLRFRQPRELELPPPEVWKPAAAAFVGAVLDDCAPESVPPWMPAALASMAFAALVAGAEADGLDGHGADAAARAALAEMAQGVI